MKVATRLTMGCWVLSGEQSKRVSGKHKESYKTSELLTGPGTLHSSKGNYYTYFREEFHSDQVSIDQEFMPTTA